VGDLYRPEEPIVYYIDRTVPERFRPIVKAGIEEWNRAFEEAGWKDAIRAEILPADADPDDLRYHTVRFITSDQPRFGAIGPSIVDPRTGEIPDADILMESNLALEALDTWRLFVDPARARTAAGGGGGEEDLADHVAVDAVLARLALGAAPP